MSYEQIPITPEIITWSRVRAGISLHDAKQSFRNIEEWENGDSYPSYPQLEKLSDKFKVPIAVFFFPEPPETPEINESFRTLPDSEIDILPTKIRFLLRKAKAFQVGLSELTNGRNPSQFQIVKEHRLKKNISISKFVERIREALGFTFEDQISWKDDDIALKTFRESLSNAGIFVFKDAFQNDDYCGFCLYDEEFPLIYINNSKTKTRQIFTLFHELAHLLFGTSGIDFLSDEFIDRIPDNERKIEIICNKFAGEFLVPDKQFNKYIDGLSANEAAAVELASVFNVSREVIYRKFLDRELISVNEYQSKAEKWRRQARKSSTESSSGNYYNTFFAYVDKPYLELAFSSYFQNKIDARQLADYLNVSQKSLSKIEEKYLGGA